MKKEALLAILIGILVGLGITYGIYRFRLSLLNSQPITEIAAPIQDTTPTPATDSLLITSPLDESVVATAQATISGTAESNDLIVVFVNDNEYITQADDIGAFAVEVSYETGSNFISITAIAEDGTQKNKELIVIYSTVSLDGSPVSTSSAQPATSSAETSN